MSHGARILIVGANGQIGTELALALSKRPGVAHGGLPIGFAQ